MMATILQKYPTDSTLKYNQKHLKSVNSKMYHKQEVKYYIMFMSSIDHTNMHKGDINVWRVILHPNFHLQV